MSGGDDACDRAHFAARAFVARWARETGEQLSAVVTDRMLFAYEMGYLRGGSDANRVASTLFDELTQFHAANKKEDQE